MTRSDKRLYAQFTLDYADSHKIAPLSDAAFRTHVKMVLWSRRMLTDGRVPKSMALILSGRKPKALAELCANDSTKPSLVIDGDDYVIHDFEQHQQTNAKIAESARIAARNGAKGGRPRKQDETKLVSVGFPSANRTESQNNPDESRVQSTELELSSTKKETASRGSRLKPEWLPNSVSVAAVRAECPNVNAQAEHKVFVDYWIAQPGAKGVKLDWDATWRNWMRRKQSDLAGARKPTRTEENLSIVAQYAAQEQPEVES